MIVYILGGYGGGYDLYTLSCGKHDKACRIPKRGDTGPGNKANVDANTRHICQLPLATCRPCACLF